MMTLRSCRLPPDGGEAQRAPAALVRRGPQESAAAEPVRRDERARPCARTTAAGVRRRLAAVLIGDTSHTGRRSTVGRNERSGRSRFPSCEVGQATPKWRSHLGLVPIEDALLGAGSSRAGTSSRWWRICQDVHRSVWWATYARSTCASMPLASGVRRRRSPGGVFAATVGQAIWMLSLPRLPEAKLAQAARRAGRCARWGR